MKFDLAVVTLPKLKGFVFSWEEAFSRKLDSSVYNWIFNENNIIYAGLVEGEIAAGYCLYPLPCILNGEEKIALLCNNVFVNPRFQGQHLFVKLGKLALDDAGRNDYGQIAFGIPNALALPGHKRVGWGVQKPIGFLEKDATAKGIQSAHWVYGALAPHQRVDIEECSRTASSGRNFSIIKTVEFINWRYESKPSVRYWFGLKYDEKGKLSAYCVCKFYEPASSLHFIDIDGVDKDAIALLIREANSLPESFDKINVWASTAHHDLFVGTEYCPSEKEDNLIFIAPEGRKPLYIEDNINICLGDNDVY